MNKASKTQKTIKDLNLDDKHLKNRMFLHAHKLKLNQKNTFTAQLPKHFEVLFKLMQWRF